MKNSAKCAFARTPKSWYKIWFARIRTKYQWNILRTGTSLAVWLHAPRQCYTWVIDSSNAWHDVCHYGGNCNAAIHESLITCGIAIVESTWCVIAMYIYYTTYDVTRFSRELGVTVGRASARTTAPRHIRTFNGSTVTTDVHSSYDHWIAHVFLKTLWGLSR